MYTKIPAYLYERGNITKLILFTAIFALLFINIFQPFNSRGWYPNISEFKYFFFSSLIVLVGMLVIVVSRFIMLSYTKTHMITYWQYGVWILSEIIAMSLFYSLLLNSFPKRRSERFC